MSKRVHRNLNRAPEEVARLKAVRERYQKDKPGVEKLLAEGGHDDTVPLGDLLVVREISRKLRETRKGLGMSLAALADKTGMDAAALSRVETGKQPNPTLGTLVRIASAMGKKLVCDLQEA